jgi:hypothetical protein
MTLSRSPADSRPGPVAQTVLISGLKRSGTTILWEAFRQDRRNLCFDEPFHPGLWLGKRGNGKGTWTELGAVFASVSAPLGADLTPIRPPDELSDRSDAAQREYLRALMLRAERTVIDDVRIWNRLPELLPDNVPTVVVHLLRDPVNWVTAQILPSIGHHRGGSLGNLMTQLRFFRRSTGYNKWRYEEIIDTALSTSHSILDTIPCPEDEFARLPAYKKLLAFWWAMNLQTRSRLATWRGGPVVNVTLSEFSADPAKVVKRIYESAGWNMPEIPINLSHVRPIRPSWRANSSKYARALAELGLPRALSEAKLLGGNAMASILDGHLPS